MAGGAELREPPPPAGWAAAGCAPEPALLSVLCSLLPSRWPPEEGPGFPATPPCVRLRGRPSAEQEPGAAPGRGRGGQAGPPVRSGPGPETPAGPQGPRAGRGAPHCGPGSVAKAPGGRGRPEKPSGPGLRRSGGRRGAAVGSLVVANCRLGFQGSGLLELPDLGRPCWEDPCKRLDFLPLTCDACKQDFCKDHFTCAAHKCLFAFKKDIRVPVCPLCNKPVPVKKGAIPDVVVGEHMDRDCSYHPGKKEKVFIHQCSKQGCKKKEMLQVTCDQCHGSFCIQHRHPLDHSCQHGSRAISVAGCAASRASEPKPSKPSGALRSLSCSWLAQQLRWKVKR